MLSKEVNPYTPGAGHSPPYLAGREREIKEFQSHLDQEQIIKNVVLTGLRGTGKTVLMEDKCKPLAQQRGWAWVGSDFSESSFLSESNLCTRLLTDLAVFTSGLSVKMPGEGMGFTPAQEDTSLCVEFLLNFFDAQPGLMVDKLKATLEIAWRAIAAGPKTGVVFAYDEAQVVRDREDKEEFPLALLLEAFQSLQRKGVKFMLLLTGLPALFPKLVESRTYAERMFTVLELGRLSKEASREAITVPLQKTKKWSFTELAIDQIISASDGYPYFIQYICRETLDHVIANPKNCIVPMPAIIRKLDSDFFAGRWEAVTDRQRDLLFCVSQLPDADGEFTISEVVEVSKKLDIKRLTPGDVSQMLPRLIEKGLVYKNRLGKYCFAVPLFSGFIKRRHEKPPAEKGQKKLF